MPREHVVERPHDQRLRKRTQRQIDQRRPGDVGVDALGQRAAEARHRAGGIALGEQSAGRVAQAILTPHHLLQQSASFAAGFELGLPVGQRSPGGVDRFGLLAVRDLQRLDFSAAGGRLTFE